MSNSSLVNCTVKSPNHSGARTHAIDRITPHCVVGQLTAESIGGCFDSSGVQASCNYGIGSDGRQRPEGGNNRVRQRQDGSVCDDKCGV